MKSKTYFYIVGTVLLVTMLFCSVIPAKAESPCDPTYVKKSGTITTVLPTGYDDTANLQCAFDWASASGPGEEVTLVAADYYIGQIVVNNFQGKFSGVGMYDTMIYNLPELYVTPVDMYLEPPSAENPWPALISFVNGTIDIMDLGMHIVGENGTTGWSIFGIEPPVIELALGIVILGETADVLVERIFMEAEVMENSLTGFNLINGLYYEGFIGEDPAPLTGSFQVYDSVFKKIGSASPVTNVVDTDIFVNHNQYIDCRAAFEITDFLDSYVEFKHNKVEGRFGVLAYPIWMTEDVGTFFRFENNQFSGTYGIILDQIFGERSQCVIKGNNVHQTTDIGVYLGVGIHDCVVMGGNTKEYVIDEGYNNTIYGPQ